MANNRSHPKPNTTKIEKLTAQMTKDPRSKDFIPLAEEYVKAGMLHEAALTLEDGLKVYPSFVTALVKLGGVYIQLQEQVKAQNRLEEAIQSSPDNILAHRMLAKLYVSNNSEWARRSCEKVLWENPHDKEMLELKRELEQADPPSPITDLQQTSSITVGPESLHRPNTQHFTSVLDQESVPPYTEPRHAAPSPQKDIQDPSTRDHTQQHIKNLSQLLERINERRAS